MIRTLLENNFVPAKSAEQTTEELEKKYQKRQLEMAERYKGIVDDKLVFENTLAETGEDHENADFSEDEALEERRLFNERLNAARDEVQSFNNELALVKKYGDTFAYLQRIKEIEECANPQLKLRLLEIAKDYARGTEIDDNYYAELAGTRTAGRTLALEVEVDDQTPPFYISLQQHDNPFNGNRETQLKISMDEEYLSNLDKERLQKILAFCESHGFSTYAADFPFSLDGLENEDRFRSIFNELKLEAAKRQELMGKQQEQLDTNLAAEETYENTSEQKGPINQAVETENSASSNPSAADKVYENFATDGKDKSFWSKIAEHIKKPFARDHAAPSASESADKKLEKMKSDIKTKMLEEALGKEKGLTYFEGKAKSYIFGRPWTVYTIFDTPDENNLAENGRRDKNGKAKFTYAYKIFVNVDDSGRLHFAYHMRDNKKGSEDMINALVGRFKDAGLTHIRFPNGVPDSDKKTWRIALAEKGIIPVNMSLDKSKAQGMLEAAKKKLSSEAYLKFKFNLGKQMDEEVKRKGKKLDTSEREYIDSLISSHYYEPFVNAYNAVIKGGLSQKLRFAGKDAKMGAVAKVAAYYAFSRLFAVYDSTARKTTIAQSRDLDDAEKRRIKAAGLDIEPHKLTKEQLVELYELLMPRCFKEAKMELDEALMQAKDVGNVAARGAKRADNIIIKEVFDSARNGFEDVNERLKNNGCDEISMPKVMGRLQYDAFYDEHPEFLRRGGNTNAAPAPTNAPNTNAGVSHEA